MNMLAKEECSALTIHNPLELLFAQYRKEKEGIETIANFVIDSHQMHYFFEAASANDRHIHASADSLFKLEPAIKALDATFWQKAMFLTDVMEYMPADKRNEWNDQIYEHKAPPFEKESVTATLIQMINNRARFMAERVDGLFRALSGSHVTNQPQAFGKRFIIDYMLSYGSIDSRRTNYIHDLRCVIGKFLNRDVPNSHSTYSDLNNMERDGQWNEFDGGAFKVRLYKKGTAHMEVHPDIAWQLNKVLAFLYPMAIPAEFRTKPKKATKTHKMHYDLISYETIKDIERGFPYSTYEKRNATKLAYKYKEPPTEPAIAVMERMGGVEVEKGVWEFGYPISPVISELSRSGRIPEKKSHQFYPTPESLAMIVVDIAGIEDHHDCLEPSAGLGGIADLMPKSTTCIDVSDIHCTVLKAKGYQVENIDFMQYGYGRTFDRICMNPPFSEGRAVAHVKHAASMLSKDGVLVAIMPSSNKGKTIVEGMKHEWSDVYENEFKDASVSVVILKLSALL